MSIDLVIEAVRQAATLCEQVQRNHLVSSEKLGKEPVTIADYGSQALICRALSQAFPDDAVIAEEQGEQYLNLVSDEQKIEVMELLTHTLDRNASQDDIVAWLDHGKTRRAARTWVIDPIDGTKGFLALRHYAIAIGIVERGNLVGGIMAAPGYNDSEGALFYALDGTAYREPLQGGDAVRIFVSDRDTAEDIRIVQSVEKEHASKGRMAQVREAAGLAESPLMELDSMEKYALVADGSADLYMRLPREGSTYDHKAWDHAAGAALVLAAGGMVTDVDGRPLDFSQGKLLPNTGMVVSNGLIHDHVLEAVQHVLNGD